MRPRFHTTSYVRVISMSQPVVKCVDVTPIGCARGGFLSPVP